MMNDNWELLHRAKTDTDWTKLINSKCLIVLYPFWSLNKGEGILREVTILKVTPDNEHMTFEFEEGFEISNDAGLEFGIKQKIDWKQTKKVKFIEKIDTLFTKHAGEYLCTHKSYAGNPAWENSVGKVIVLGFSPSGEYIKCIFIRSDETKNIRWEERDEIILKYKIIDEDTIVEIKEEIK